MRRSREGKEEGRGDRLGEDWEMRRIGKEMRGRLEEEKGKRREDRLGKEWLRRRGIGRREEYSIR